MDGSIIDHIQGKRYDLKTFENEIVKVESAGRCIRIGIKNDSGVPFSWFEPTHPFYPTPSDISWPSQNGWLYKEETPSEDVYKGIFEREDNRHILTLRVTDPSANPKPVEVTWE